jgi:hypothetical protein
MDGIKIIKDSIDFFNIYIYNFMLRYKFYNTFIFNIFFLFFNRHDLLFNCLKL